MFGLVCLNHKYVTHNNTTDIEINLGVSVKSKINGEKIMLDRKIPIKNVL
jgi:hypothetical protein